MKISPNYDNQEYYQLDFKNEDDWQKSHKYVGKPNSGRFFRPVELMREYRYSGFAIMALDCLLIETLNSF